MRKLRKPTTAPPPTAGISARALLQPQLGKDGDGGDERHQHHARPANLKIDWMRAAERASAALFEGLLPEASPAQIDAARSRWKLTLSQLHATT